MWRLETQPVSLHNCTTLVLFSLDGKLGDAILQSALVRLVHENHPACKITIVAAVGLADYWRECHGVSAVHPVSSRSDASSFSRIRELAVIARIPGVVSADLMISFDPIPMVDYFVFIRRCRPRTAISLSALQYAIFDISIVDPILEIPREHVGLRVVRILATLGVVVRLEDLRGVIPLRDARKSHSNDTSLRRRSMVFVNGFGASATRTFSVEQLDGVVRRLLSASSDLRIVGNVNAAQRGSPRIEQLLAEFPGRVELLPSNGKIAALFDSITHADAVLTPDTSVGHIAAAQETPAVVVYDDVGFNPVCWRPLGRNIVQLIPETPGPVSRFSVPILVEALRAVLKSIE